MKKVLIVKPSSLGDVLHAFPAVNALCRETGAKADWLIHPAFAPLLNYLTCVENVIPFDRQKLGSAGTFLPAYFKLRRELRKNRYDAVIDLQGLFRSAWFASMAKAPVHAGFAKPREGISTLFYNRKIKIPPETVHAVEKNNTLIAGVLGKRVTRMDFTCPIPIVEEYQAAAEELMQREGIDGGKILIGVAPGARWVTKCWPPSFYAKVLSKLARVVPDVRFLLLGTAEDHTAATAIRQKLSDPAMAYDLCGKTSMGELVELIRKCSLFFSNDSGPMHIAAILNVPTVAPFGATSPDLTGPYSENSIVIQPDLACIQCFQRHCKNMKCHTMIMPETAVNAALELLAP